MPRIQSKTKPPITIDYEAIPDLLKEIDQWIIWDFRLVKGTTDQWDKPPIHPETGQLLSSRTTRTFSYQQCEAAARSHGYGLGFRITPDDFIRAIDIDGCVLDGKLTPLASNLTSMSESYAEISPSGTGVRILLTGEIDSDSKSVLKKPIEVFVSSGYVTITGKKIGGSNPVIEQNQRLCDLISEFAGRGYSTAKGVAIAATLHLGDDYLDDYDQWLHVLMALHDTDDSLLDFAIWWSSLSPNFTGADDVQAKWRSFGRKDRSGRPLTVKSLTNWAGAYGYDPPRVQLDDAIDEIDLANQVAQQLVSRLIYVPDWKKWCHWNGKNFDLCSDHGVAIQQLEKLSTSMPQLKKYRNARRVDTMAKFLTTRPQLRVGPKEFDPKGDRLVVANGVINLESREFTSHDPANRNLSCAPVQYREGAGCPRWEKFISDSMLGKQQRIDYVQRMCGYLLTASTVEQCLFLMVGEGANGKGIFCQTLSGILGEYSMLCDSRLLSKRIGDKHSTELMDLYQRRLAVVDEVARVPDESMIKWLTGSSPIRGNRMRENNWQFDATHKFVLQMNRDLIIRGNDDGIWRRIHYVPWDRVVPKSEQIPAYDRILLAEEGSGILNWSLEGLKQWRLQGLNRPKELSDRVEAYRKDMDVVRRFLEEACEESQADSASAKMLYQVFMRYCGSEGVHPMSKIEFGRQVVRLRGVQTDRKRDGWYHPGIKIRAGF